MRVVELKVQNLRKIRIIAIRPASNIVLLTGENGAGKSSVLDAISVALRGRAYAGPKPIRAGEEECRLKLDLGEYVIVRSFKNTPDGDVTTKLSVTMADGSKPAGTPQAILNSLNSDLSFDPLAFGKWDPKKQFDAVRGLVQGYDFEKHQQDYDRDFAARTELNRRAKEHEAAAGKIILAPGPKPVPVVIADVIAQLDAAQKANADLTTRAARRGEARIEIDRINDEAEKLRMQAAEMIRKADELEARGEELDRKLATADPLPEPTDEAGLRRRLNEAETINAQARAHEARAEHERQTALAKAAAEKLTDGIETREKAKRSAIAATKMPVDGLDLVDGQVLLNGLPFSTAGTAERIRAGMAISMSLNPKVKVVLIDEAAELSKASIDLVAALAEERGFQVWLSTPHHDSGRPEIEIVDGEVKG